MTDRLDDLERLQRLRSEGAIDGDEFAAEKARILQGAHERSPRKARAWLIPAIGLGVVAAGGLVYAMVAPDPRLAVENTSVGVESGTESAPSLSNLSPAERLKRAEQAVFPNGRVGKTEDGLTIAYEPGRLVESPFGPVLVNEGRVPRDEGGHVTSGEVTVHYLAVSGDGYRVVKAFPHAVLSGSFGQMSEMAVSDKFSDFPVVYTQGGMTNQGYTVSCVVLTELRPEGPVELVTFQDYDSNGGSLDDQSEETEGKIQNIVRGSSFEVKFTGTRSFTARYVRSGNEYRLQGGDQNLLGEGCRG